MRKFQCSICGYIYDESAGTKWEALPEDFICPLCSATKSLFKPLAPPDAGNTDNRTPAKPAAESPKAEGPKAESRLGLSAEEISAICSSLAKGCEKQRLSAEMEAFTTLAAFYKAKAVAEKGTGAKDAMHPDAVHQDALHFQAAATMLEHDLTAAYPAANDAAKANADRGALRSLVWSEKVSAMMQSLLERFAREGDAMLAHTKVYVCDICGFVYLGDTLPDICPVCKVPNFKMISVGRS